MVFLLRGLLINGGIGRKIDQLKKFNEIFDEEGNARDINDWDKIEYVPGYHGQEPPDVKDCDVIIVDFSYDEKTMGQIALDCKSLIWIDHHKTAIPVFDVFSQFIGGATPLKTIFDLNKSGAGLTWDYFFPNQTRPWLVDYVEDRDLWRKSLDNSDIVNAYIACLEFDFRIWDAIEGLDLEVITERGLTAILKTNQYVREVCKNVYFSSVIKVEEDGAKVFSNIPIVNIAQVDCSEVLHELCNSIHNHHSLYIVQKS